MKLPKEYMIIYPFILRIPRRWSWISYYKRRG